MADGMDTITFEVTRWDLEVLCHELSAFAEWFPIAWSTLRAARAEARVLNTRQAVSITLVRDHAFRLVGWIEDHSSKITAQRAAKEAFSRFLTAISNSAGAKGGIYIQIAPEDRWLLLEQPNLSLEARAQLETARLNARKLATSMAVDPDGTRRQKHPVISLRLTRSAAAEIMDVARTCELADVVQRIRIELLS